MSVSGRGTGHYRHAPEPCLTRAPLVTHPYPTVTRTGRGRLQLVYLVRGRIHKRCHPVSLSVVELLRKERRAMSVNIIASKMGSPVSSGFTNSWIVCFAPADAKHSNGSDRHLRHTISQSLLHSEGSSQLSSPSDLTHRRKDEDGEAIYERERNWGLQQQKWTHTYICKQTMSPPQNGLNGRQLGNTSHRATLCHLLKRPNKLNATKHRALR
jgi:sarcosine oxidase delta subunit